MRRLLTVSLVVITLMSFLLVFVPAYIIRPFVAQTSKGLTIAYYLRSISPWTTLGLACAGGYLIYGLWSTSKSGIVRAVLGTAALILIVSAVMSRQNHFEWMFRPMGVPGFVAIPKATHVTDSDMVLSINLGGESRAYPVRILAYHHLVNDVVAGQPVVVTY